MFDNLNLTQKMMLGVVVIIGIFLSYAVISETREFFVKNRRTGKIKQKLYEQGISAVHQISVIGGLISIFNLAAFYSQSVTADTTAAVWCIWGITLSCLLLAAGIWLFTKTNRKNVKSVKQILKDNKEILLLLLVAAIARIVMFSNLTIERWDAGEYYYRLGTACENYDFRWQSIWDNFRLCNHSSIGFAMLYAIGEFLFPRKVIGVLGVNLIMTLAALYMIYEMLQKYWMSFGKKQAFTATLLVSVAPMFLGTFGYVNTDYVLAIVFVYMIYAQYKGHYLLLTFWGVILTQTKETAVFVVAGYFIAHLISWMISYKGNVFQKIDAVLKKRVTWSVMIVGAVYARYVYKLRAFTAWSQTKGASSQVFWSNSGENCFGIQLPYIWLRIKQFFFLNFAWIFTLLLITAILLILIRKIKISVSNMEGIYGGLIGFMCFSSLYVTAEISRYNILVTMMLILVAFCVVEQVLMQLNRSRSSIVLWGSLTILLVLQTFMQIDGVSGLLFKLVNTGTTKMLFTADVSDYYGDHLVNNYQYTWLERAYDAMLKDVEYHDNVLIIIPDDQYAGSHIHGNEEAYSVFWDTKKERRVMYQNQNTIDINAYSVIEVMNAEKEDLPEKAVIFFIPYYELNEEEQLAVLASRYQVIQEKNTMGSDGSIRYYVLEKNNKGD